MTPEQRQARLLRSVPTAEDFVREARMKEAAEKRERRNFYLAFVGVMACSVMAIVVTLWMVK